MLIPFDYDLAKVALAMETGRVVTRDGQSVELVGIEDPANDEYPVIGRIGNCNENDYWTEEGKYLWYRDSDLDIFIEDLC